MPELPGRSKYEIELTRIMARLLSAYAGRLLELLGDPPNLANLPPDFWQNESEVMVAALRPFLEQVYLDSARAMMGSTVSAIDWALVNQAAVDWASTYTFNLIQGLFQTDIGALQRALAAYYQAPTTMGELTARILQIIASPIRAEMIAVTEVTRAAAEGERAIAAGLAKQGIVMTPIWKTNNDELVCPICAPRNQQEITDDIYPPAHPRCRCWVSYELPKKPKKPKP